MTDRPVLLFPTHYLGNFILGLPWVLRVAEEYPSLTLVIDARFRELIDTVVPSTLNVIEYPRQRLKTERGVWSRARCYLTFLRQLRTATDGLLVDMEGERFTGVLARLSGAQKRFGPTGKHAQYFYNSPRELHYENHRYSAFGEILDALIKSPAPSNLLPYRLQTHSIEAVDDYLRGAGISQPFVVIHPGASADYKKWPVEYFVSLLAKLETSGLQVVWIGAGDDKRMIASIAAASPQKRVRHFDLMGYPELVALFHKATTYIGGDSGPMHLAASAGLRLVALFGPSKEAIWAPLGEASIVLRGPKACGKDCDAWQCEFGYHCLSSLTPERVFDTAIATQPLQE